MAAVGWRICHLCLVTDLVGAALLHHPCLMDGRSSVLMRARNPRMFYIDYSDASPLLATTEVVRAVSPASPLGMVFTLAGPIVFFLYLLLGAAMSEDKEEARVLMREDMNDASQSADKELQRERKREAARPQTLAEAIRVTTSPAELVRDSLRFGVRRDTDDPAG